MNRNLSRILLGVASLVFSTLAAAETMYVATLRSQPGADGSVAGGALYVVDLATAAERSLTRPEDDADAPDTNGAAWSHDGTRIAFFCGFEENNPIKRLHQNVCVINVDGTGRRVPLYPTDRPHVGFVPRNAGVLASRQRSPQD